MNDILAIKKIYRKKVILIFAVALIGVITYFFFLAYMLQFEAMNKQNRKNNRFFSATLSNLTSNADEMDSLLLEFHINNNILLHNLVKAYSGSNYRRLQSLTMEQQAKVLQDASVCMDNCAWVLIVDRKGEVLASDYLDNVGVNIVEDTGNDMTMEEFKRLCSGTTDYIMIKNPYNDYYNYTGSDLYVYCEAIPGTYGSDGDKYILLAFNSQILETMEATMGDLSSWINDSTIGNGGTAFVIDADLDIVDYGSIQGKDMKGQKASETGFTTEVLTNRYSGVVPINGVDCYVSTRSFSSVLYGANCFIATVVPVKDLKGINSAVILWNISLFAVAVFLVIVYASYIRGELMRRGEPLREKRVLKRKGVTISFSRVLARKILPIVFATAVLMWGAVFYYQTLMKLSECFSETVSIESDIMRSVEKSSELQKELKNYYNMQYASRSEAISSIIAQKGDEYLNNLGNAGAISQYDISDESGKRDLVKDKYGNPIYVLNNSKPLIDLANENEVGNISLISDNGVAMATSSDYWNYILPNDPAETAYVFWDVLYGKAEHTIVDEVSNEEGMLIKEVACSLDYYTCLDENGNTKYVNYIEYVNQDSDPENGNSITKHRGLVLVEVKVGANEYVLDNSKPEYVLSNTHISNDGFLSGFEYSEKDEDYKVFYSQKPYLIGKTAKDLGISEKAFTGNYNGFQRFESDLYLESFREAENYYISTALPVGSLFKDNISSSGYCAVYILVIMLIISVFMVLVSNRGEEKLYKDETNPLALFFKITKHEGWHGKSPSEKFEIIVQNSLIVLGLIFLLSVLLDGKRLGSESAILYIVSGQWDRGIHIFSISACIVIIIVATIVINIFGRVAYIYAEAFGNRVVTMMHMVIALIKTLAAAIVLLYCLYLMGIDGTSLLASAGIMSVVVGLGAQSLVGDLLAGIFIILEGSLRVGDYVMINGVRGKVIQIGLRITRYEDDNQNIMMICNNELKSFSNMSMKYSVVYFNIPVPYNEDYKRIKEILNKEFLRIYEENKFLKSIPVCMGIEEFSESSVDIRIKFMCEESERFNVQRFMRDEIIEILTKNDISIPFNQLDVHIEHEHVLKDDALKEMN